MIATIPSVERRTRPKLSLGPEDHGRAVSLEDFENANYRGGYQYELIDGRIYVSMLPDPPHDSIELWLVWLLQSYSFSHCDIINHVSNKTRVFVPERKFSTCPEPDVAAFRGYPHDRAEEGTLRWNEVSPLLVVEVVSPSNPEKDFTRNVELYEQVPSIREYWIFSREPDSNCRTLLVYRRRGKKWQKPIAVEPGQTYTTRLLPGFELKLDAPPE